MQLTAVRIQNYKSIDDSGWVDIDDVTCLVGKNESGKTAFLQALSKLNPVAGQSGDFDMTIEYPRRHLNRYKREHAARPAGVVSARFILDDSSIGELPQILADSLAEREITVSRSYRNRNTWSVRLDEPRIVAQLVAEAELPAEHTTRLAALPGVADLVDSLDELGDDPPQAASLRERIGRWRNDSPTHAVIDALESRVPRFFYFDDYSIMQGRISLPELKRKRDAGDLDEADQTFLALLRFVGAELEEFESEANYERLKADLEAASNEISDELFSFWSQNDQLEVEFDISAPDPDAPPPLNAGTNLHVRIKNGRHRATVAFDQRSRGFVWFFSFLAYFSELNSKPGQPLILLLDEPGLNLHAKAQEDFLRFINERLAPEYQVIYSTHSPFMVDPTRLGRVRTVEDSDDEGTKVSDEVFRSNSDTVFPLQAAFGYELAQTLFVAPNNLLVEGPSDLIYLQFLSDLTRERGLAYLDERWVIVPVGGIDKIATFVTLLGGNKLNTSVLIDVSSKDQQRVKNLRENGHLGTHSLVQIGEITGAKDADVEDLFAPTFYLDLVNSAFAQELPKRLTLKSLGESKHPRIVKRIEAHFARNDLGQFSHYRPAAYLMRNQAELASKVGDEVFDRASALFERINETLNS